MSDYHRNQNTASPMPLRFWEKVAVGAPDECWLWQAQISGDGYGRFKLPGRTVGGAHRASYELTHGPIPEGMQVCHSCDVRACVNPHHLWLGSNDDNVRDSVAKGRRARQYGSANGFSRFTESEIRDIRALASIGIPQRQIAKRYGSSSSTISRIVTEKAWRHAA